MGACVVDDQGTKLLSFSGSTFYIYLQKDPRVQGMLLISCACKHKTVVSMAIYSPRTSPGLFVYPTSGAAFSVERFCFIFVVPLHTTLFFICQAYHSFKQGAGKVNGSYTLRGLSSQLVYQVCKLSYVCKSK